MRLIEVIALGTVIVGWFATHLFSEARERRKEIRSQLDRFLERLSKLEADAITFHTAAVFDASKVGTLLAEVERVERVLSRLPVGSPDDFTGLIIHHRRAITLRNFDSTRFVTQVLGSNVLLDIGTATRDIEDEVERMYLKRFPPRFPYYEISTVTILKLCLAVVVVTCLGVLLRYYKVI